MQYVYPAIFYRAVEGGYCVEFPDVEGAVTCGENLYQAIEMAEDVLALMLCDWEDFKAGRFYDRHGNKLPPFKNRIVDPTPIEKVTAAPNEFSTSAFVTLIKADTDAYRKVMAEFPQKDDVIPQQWRDEFNKADEKFLAREITLFEFERILHDLYVKYDGSKYLKRSPCTDDDDDDIEIKSAADEENGAENIAVHS